MDYLKMMREGYRLHYARIEMLGRLFWYLKILFFLLGCVLLLTGIAYGKMILGILCIFSFICSYIFGLLLSFCIDAYNS
jgi:hypothetical protein